MRSTIAALAVVLALTGCAGLAVSWEFQATYNRPHLVPSPQPAVVPGTPRQP